MKKNLDLNRLGMVIRWDVLNNWTYNLGVIAGLAICFSIANIIRLYRISGFIAASHELDAMTDSYKESAYMFFGFISFMVIYVLASCIFRNMKTKLQRESFLMLPATNLEKYVARFLVVTVGGLVTLLGALVISDIIQLIFSFCPTPNGYVCNENPGVDHTVVGNEHIHDSPCTHGKTNENRQAGARWFTAVIPKHFREVKAVVGFLGLPQNV
jgi:hypothetical protein